MHQRYLVNDRTPRGIDQERGCLHLGKLRAVKQSPRFRKERHVHADKVRLRQQCIEITTFRLQFLFDTQWSADPIAIDNSHLESRCAPSHGAPDASKSDQSQGLAPNVGTDELIEVPTLPIAG